MILNVLPAFLSYGNYFNGLPERVFFSGLPARFSSI
jgi:hypothetical protein